MGHQPAGETYIICPMEVGQRGYPTFAAIPRCILQSGVTDSSWDDHSGGVRGTELKLLRTINKRPTQEIAGTHRVIFVDIRKAPGFRARSNAHSAKLLAGRVYRPPLARG